MFKEISDETLLEDYRNTEKEYKAYRDIAAGFETLAALPENRTNSYWITSAMAYHLKEKECYEFFLKLQSIKNERGL